MLMAGNVVPSYDDEGGRVVRRLAMFPFNTLVAKRDTTLKERICRDELPTIALRCMAAYRDLRERVGDGDVRAHLPDRVVASEEEIRMATTPLYDFVKNGNDFYDVVNAHGATTPVTNLRDAFNNHVKYRQRDGAKWPSDYHAIKAAGFTVKRNNVCKVCGKHATRKGCGTHYDARNRKRVCEVEGMRLVRKGCGSVPYDGMDVEEE